MTPADVEQREPYDLTNAVVYDIETLPNLFSLYALGLFSDLDVVFEISPFRDDRREMLQWFEHWRDNRVPMIGFNNIAFDYPVIHAIYNDPYMSVEAIYDHAMSIIASSNERFGHTIWESDRFAPQIDLLKIHHFDNHAKRTSLKALEVNMRSETVMDMPIPFNQPVTPEQIDTLVIPYNGHDTGETRKFAHISMEAIKFRLGLMSTLHGDVLNWSDTKIGGKILEQRLGEDVCYSRESGSRRPRQTFRSSIRLDDIIFPYIKFKNPEFNRVLSWMRTQSLTADELTESIQTKGVFTGVTAHVGGIDFCFGTGGIHGSVNASRFASDENYAIVDIDVASLYPNIAIQNKLYPEHLGEAFVREYAKLPQERKEWQAKKGKKCVEANAMKLAANGTYGNSNNKYSVFYDPRFTMTITINGQLLLCMLAEWLLTVDTLQIIQVNTDGITFRVHRSRREHAEIIQRIWERTTRLTLEEAEYSRMWIRDVNNYIAQPVQGDLKMKGAYWYPVKFPDDISHAQPPAWHKDFSAVVSTKAAVAHMTQGVSLEDFIYGHGDPFDFMCRAKVDRSSRLMIGDQEVQRITRYYVSTNGAEMKKVSPPAKGARVGDYKRRNGISDYEYVTVLQEVGEGAWDSRIHTKNKSRYVTRETSIEAGWLVADCCDAHAFDWETLNYQYYIDRAKKLIIE